MNLSFENKVALVTGTGSLLGLATAKAFAESGASVALADWNEKAVRSATAELAAQGHNALAIHCDVADDAQVEAMIEQTVATFGRLDAAYNNAGVQNIVAETADASREDFDRVIAINLRGVWSCMKFELRQMSKQGSDAIVNCSSLGGLVGAPRTRNLPRRQTRSARTYEERCSRICLPWHLHQRSLPGHHRDPDGHGHAGHSSGSHERADETGADRPTWPARGDRRCRSSAV
jgi:NAD(P)-dependent dehydrogenase (short-subunit alcohol dehydrogenase family)